MTITATPIARRGRRRLTARSPRPTTAAPSVRTLIVSRISVAVSCTTRCVDRPIIAASSARCPVRVLTAPTYSPATSTAENAPIAPRASTRRVVLRPLPSGALSPPVAGLMCGLGSVRRVVGFDVERDRLELLDLAVMLEVGFERVGQADRVRSPVDPDPRCQFLGGLHHIDQSVVRHVEADRPARVHGVGDAVAVEIQVLRLGRHHHVGFADPLTRWELGLARVAHRISSNVEPIASATAAMLPLVGYPGPPPPTPGRCCSPAGMKDERVRA